jgi:CRP-like cAMP-binding protein
MAASESSVSSNPYRNQILRGLNADDLASLKPHLEPVALSLKELLYDQGGPIDFVYFVESGVVSLITALEEGGSIETGTVGNEGMVGIPAFLGMEKAPGRALCQIPGHALKLTRAAILAERQRGGRLADLLFRFTNAMMAMLAQTAACNRAHPVEERMCRWLLMTHDRANNDEFPLTEEFLSQMLGVRRPSVNLAAASLQHAGLIHFTRGRVTILDRVALEASACECYANIRREFELAYGD